MQFDLFIIGGGINGCAIAADAAGRGLSVALCEKDDLAFATSSSSTKLIHGGLRYLEQYEFKLVRDSLREREILMSKAPFAIHPMEFVLPHNDYLRPAWIIQIGLLLYDLLYPKRLLPRSKKLNFAKTKEGEPLKGEYKVGFRYTDCWVDDSRLVILNALAAQEKGARILTRTDCTHVKRESDHWEIQCHDRLRDKNITFKAKAVINATGPWATEVLQKIAHVPSKSKLRLIKGSHIVVPKLYDGKHAYTLQHTDGRIIFALPFKNKFTLIGTTDVPYEGDPNLAAISNSEINYLCEIINHYFSKPTLDHDIVWSYAGVRPLFDDLAQKPSKITRESHIEINELNRTLPFVTLFGGKLTTHRVLAEEVMKKLKPYFPNMGPAWTAKEKLPGGHCDGLSYPNFIKSLQKQYDWLPPHILRRYAKTYGDRCHLFLSDCRSLDDLGRYFGETLYEREVIHMIKNEWAQKADDILWRRTKLALKLDANEIKALEEYLDQDINL